MNPGHLFAGIPEKLRGELIAAFTEITRNFREQRWEPSELNGGKLCEIVYSILRGHVDGKYPAKATKPRNMLDACKELENADKSFSRSIRIQIPRMLIALYEVRNSRGVGHVGGDVNPNKMDARLVLESSKWTMAELVRVFHDLDTTAATKVVDALTDRTLPIVWSVGNKRRVLDPKLSMRDQTLLLLYSTSGSIKERDLLLWTEHSNSSVYRRDVLRHLHNKRLIDYDSSTGEVEISPTGIAHVESNLPLSL